MAASPGDVMRNAHEAFVAGDMEALRRECLSADLVFHVPGRSQVAGTYRGVEEFFGYVQKLMELSGGTFRVENHDIVSSDEHAVNLDHITASRGGKDLSVNLLLLAHVRDGRVGRRGTTSRTSTPGTNSGASSPYSASSPSSVSKSNSFGRDLKKR